MKNGIHGEIKSSQIRGKSATIRFRKFSPPLTKYETVKTLAYYNYVFYFVCV